MQLTRQTRWCSYLGLPLIVKHHTSASSRGAGVWHCHIQSLAYYLRDSNDLNANRTIHKDDRKCIQVDFYCVLKRSYELLSLLLHLSTNYYFLLSMGCLRKKYIFSQTLRKYAKRKTTDLVRYTVFR